MKKKTGKQTASAVTTISENGLNLVLEKFDDGAVALLHLGPEPFDPATVGDAGAKRQYRIAQIHCTGENQCDHHGEKLTGGSVSSRLKLEAIVQKRNATGLKVEVVQRDEDRFRVVSHIQFYKGVPAVRCWTEVRNTGTQPQGLEFVSSFTLNGIAKEGMARWDKKVKLHVPHNAWMGEGQWKSYSLPELGLDEFYGFSMKSLRFSGTGTWTTSNHLAIGAIENTEAGHTLMWEVEHNGSWVSELGTLPNTLHLLLSGPVESMHQWWKQLQPGETLETVPVAVVHVAGGFEAATAAMMDYRRRTRRANPDNRNCPVIFNDYMNCLFGDPTTEKLIPLIDAAASAGCEYFVIDAGWYGDGSWWDTVGEWLPSQKRFPGGIEEPLRHIRKRGMIPGLWLELEVMGIKCPLATQWPDECFFMRHGKRVMENGRYQLDFRHPKVVKHCDAVVTRLVEEYGAGYIKMDYNINAGIGTEVGADSVGDGLLQHNRAYLAWLDKTFKRYPKLVIENCSSGGMRMNHSLLSRCSIQSSSDQMDYRKYATIATGCAAAVTPEQCAVWSYPMAKGDAEETVFNMVNAMLQRIHQSGHLAQLSSERLALVKEGIACYKTFRRKLPSAHAFWPLGLPRLQDGWVALGMDLGDESLVAVWRLNGGSPVCELPLRKPFREVERIYPLALAGEAKLEDQGRKLVVSLPQPYSARLFRVR